MGAIKRGVFRENPLIGHIAGLAPALMVTTHLVYGVTIGLGVIGVTLAAVSTLYPLRPYLSRRIALTATLVIVATYVSLFARIIQLSNPYLLDKLWIFLPILTVNCVILYSTRGVRGSYPELLYEGFGRALGYAGALLLISTLREILAFGTLTFSIGPDGGQVVEILPVGPISLAGYLAGGFILLGYIRAIYQKSTVTREERKEEPEEA